MLAVAQPAHEGDDVETELVVRQGEAPLSLGPVRLANGRTLFVAAAPDREVQAGNAFERGEGAAVGVVGAHVRAAVRTTCPLRGQVVGNAGLESLGGLGHRSVLHDGHKP